MFVLGILIKFKGKTKDKKEKSLGAIPAINSNYGRLVF